MLAPELQTTELSQAEGGPEAKLGRSHFGTQPSFQRQEVTSASFRVGHEFDPT